MGTVPSIYVPTAGDDATQPRVLTWVDGINFLLGNTTSGGSKKANGRLRQTVAQSIPTSAFTPVTFDIEDVDYDNGHSTSVNTSRYTAQTTGWYDVEALVAFAANATGVRMATFLVNGVQGNGCQIESGGLVAFPWCAHLGFSVFLNAGDYLELAIWQNSGGALNTAAAAVQSCSMAVKWRSN